MEKITEQLITEKFITELPIDHIFVFGSNSAGIHGAGAARIALLFFNAKTGVGNGLTGQSYAIPTKNEHIRSNSLRVIDIFVKQFIHYICVTSTRLTKIVIFGVVNSNKISPSWISIPPCKTTTKCKKSMFIHCLFY